MHRFFFVINFSCLRYFPNVELFFLGCTSYSYADLKYKIITTLPFDKVRTHRHVTFGEKYRLAPILGIKPSQGPSGTW